MNTPEFIPRNSPGGTNMAQKAVTPKNGQQQIVTNVPAINIIIDQDAATPSHSGQQHFCVETPAISLEDRMLLDALVSSNPLNSLTPSHDFSTGKGVKNMNNLQCIEQHQGKAVIAKVQNKNALMIKNLIQNLPNTVNLGKDIYEEGEEDEMLQQCLEEAAKRGDVSPVHSGKSKKSQTRKKSLGRQDK